MVHCDFIGQGYISVTIFHYISNTIEISFCSHPIFPEPIVSNFCTTAVACATRKICSDVMAKNGITMKRIFHGPLIICVKLWVVHAPAMSGTFSSSPRVSDPDMHHGMCVTHMPWCMLGSLTSNFFWVHWLGKLSRHSRRMRYQQFYVSGKRLIDLICDRKGVSEMGPDTKLQLNT